MSVFHQNILAGASGAAGGASALYVDDVFSTFLYEGNEGANTIDNGIDLSGEGGLVWCKRRNAAERHALFDTERGVTKILASNENSAERTRNFVTSFNSNGWSMNNGDTELNNNNDDYVSWTFRKAPGFFDVVTWTGNGSVRTISHNLGSTPGWIVIKRTSASEDWTCYHRSIGATDFIQLNGTSAKVDLEQFMNDTEPTSTHFTVGTHDRVNTSGQTYVAYVFAHDDQSFGTDSDEAIIKCGTYTGNSVNDSSTQNISVGFEPQWVLVKKTSGTADWVLIDNMRGERSLLYPSSYKIEETSNSNFKLITPDGFKLGASSDVNENSGTFIYIAIRRPHKPPTAGTEVFDPRTASSYAQNSDIPCGFAPDFMIATARSTTLTNYAEARLTDHWFDTSSTAAENTTNYFKWDGEGGKINLPTAAFDSNPIFWQFRRAPGFFDVVTYSGTGADQVVNHGLGVTPELMILKARTTTTAWRVFYKEGSTEKNLQLSTQGAAGNIPASHPWSPSSTTFRADQYFSLSQSGQDFIAYAFASLDGISKIGTYSGSSSAVTVDCGFSSGPRFIIIKATNRSEPWYVFDSARGIVSGNDPHLQLQSTAAENSGDDVIDPTSSGFTVNTGYGSGFNESGNTYLFFAIA